MVLGKQPFRPKIWRSIHKWWWANGSRKIEGPVGASNEQWNAFYNWTTDHKQFNKHGELINMRTLTIELRFDADEEERHDVLKKAAMEAAKHLFTQALLIGNKRKPQIAMYSSDMFVGQEEISLADDLPELAGE